MVAITVSSVVAITVTLTCTLGVGGSPLLTGLSALFWSKKYHIDQHILSSQKKYAYLAAHSILNLHYNDNPFRPRYSDII